MFSRRFYSWTYSYAFWIRPAVTIRHDQRRTFSPPAAEVEMEDRNRNAAKLNPITKAFLEGVYDNKCVLNKLHGLWNILQTIMKHVRNYWKENIVETRSIRNKERVVHGDIISYLNLHKPVNSEQFPYVHGYDYGQRKIEFPRRSDININMMPFVLHEEFKKCRLPSYLKDYWNCIISDCIFDDDEIGKICYLTIHESEVSANETQRRPGIHTEKPGRLELRGGSVSGFESGQGSSPILRNRVFDDWGCGIASYEQDSFEIRGGIFMASNVPSSCRVWDCQIVDDNCIGHLGDIEHLRSLLPESEVMEPNCLYWLTDRTPHESLPLRKKTYRQFFRLVTSQVSLWFEDHSTKNPLGVVPDPNSTKIVKGSKFKKGEAYIVSDATE